MSWTEKRRIIAAAILKKHKINADTEQALIPGFYSSSQLQDLLGCSPQYVWAVAKREKFSYIQVGRAKLYVDQDVRDFLATRTRTILARKLGGFFKGPGLYRDPAYDIECPVCFEFAIERPPTPEEVDTLAWQAGEYETVWLCVNDHSGGG
jgi:hypothetical protein